jgi:hypothetical protein
VLPGNKGVLMCQESKGVPLTGQAGEMLGKCLNDVRSSGVVLGLCELCPDTAELKGVVCQWCANDSEVAVSLDLMQQTTFKPITRHQSMIISLFACSSCFTALMQSLTDVRKRRSGR